MAVTRAHTVPWPPLSASLADDSSDADAKRRDAKLPDADAFPQTDADADADANAVTIAERRRQRDARSHRPMHERRERGDETRRRHDERSRDRQILRERGTGRKCYRRWKIPQMITSGDNTRDGIVNTRGTN
ncbi:hypothetical protein PUN28_003239 [Cardiocondyla obscurior]|uniref:Uncharacterized protein n=1 Tax=Cardiocondyla obscurior TaxID=286306 RepID=A0AAW2GI06_9HYME